jgi:hypothetical protein
MNKKYLHIDGYSNEKTAKISLKIPFKILSFVFNLLNLIPEKIKDQLNKEMADKGVNLNLNDISKEDVSSLLDTVEDISMRAEDSKQSIKIYVE